VNRVCCCEPSFKHWHSFAYVCFDSDITCTPTTRLVLSSSSSLWKNFLSRYFCMAL